MTQTLVHEIQETQRQIAAIDASVEERIRAIQSDAATKIAVAVKDADATKAGLAVRLLHLEAAHGCSPPKSPVDAPSSVAAPNPAAPGPRPSARDVILKALNSHGPLPSSRLDAAVIAVGWTKSAAVKTRTILKRRGLAVVDRRLWTITEAGKEKVRGADP